jgi:glycosyltransferase involved in cell wall biosynthesis
MKNLVLIIDKIGSNWSFLKDEIPFLSEKFHQIYLIPINSGSKIFDLPNNVYIINEFAEFLSKNKKRIFNQKLLYNFKIFFKELLEIPFNKFYFYNLKHTLYIYHLSIITRNWFTEFIIKRDIKTNDCLIYNYWFNFTTIGTCLLKLDHTEIKVITRAHGGDLYLDRRKGRFFPFRKTCIQLIDKLFFISNNGKEYFSKTYSIDIQKLKVARLGVPDPGFLASPSEDGNIRIVSCSYIVPVKRIHLIFEGLRYLCKIIPEKTIYWSHFGGGPLLNEIIDLIKDSPKNLIPNLFGYQENNKVLEYYRNNSIDLFINTSESEGIPMSIMEAQSFGIPVIATRVGGIPEIINNENGYLLSKNPTKLEISEKILKICNKPIEEKLLTSEACRLSWSTKYDSSVNFKTFAEIIYKI